MPRHSDMIKMPCEFFWDCDKTKSLRKNIFGMISQHIRTFIISATKIDIKRIMKLTTPMIPAEIAKNRR